MPQGVYEHRRAGIWNQRRYDPATGCWIFTGNRPKLPNGQLGYGLVRYGHRRKQVSVHRLAAHLWLRFDLESKLEVLHKCDNPGCFNPKHLFVGTQKENIRDAMAKGRFLPRFKHKAKTQCSKGHDLTGKNLGTRIQRGYTCYYCKRCSLESTWRSRGKVIPLA